MLIDIDPFLSFQLLWDTTSRPSIGETTFIAFTELLLIRRPFTTLPVDLFYLQTIHGVAFLLIRHGCIERQGL